MGIDMKIEKMNDHQIRCTLTREDLASRQIKLSEFAYGSEKTKSLFRELMEQAANEFGFEVDDLPLMIEAIPISQEKIILIITKVEAPDELDTRFSNFTHPDSEDLSDDSDAEPENASLQEVNDIASELLELFRHLKAEHSEKHSQEEKPQKAEEEIKRLFSFRDLETAIAAAHALDGFYQGENSLYKNSRDHRYYLILRQGSHTVSDFNRVSNVLSAYLDPQKLSSGMQAYFEEHCKTVLAGHALQSLAEL